MPLHLSAACLQSSRSLVFQRLQRISRAPNLVPPRRRYTPPDLHASSRQHACSASPELRYLCASSSSSTSLHVQHASRAPDHTTMSVRLSAPPELQGSRGKLLHVPTPAARLQSSGSLETKRQRLQRISGAPIPLCLLRVATRAARLQSSRAPYLYIPYTFLHRLQSSTAPYLRVSSTSLRRQRASRAAEPRGS